MRTADISENTYLHELLTTKDKQTRVSSAIQVTSYIEDTKCLNEYYQNLESSSKNFQLLRSHLCLFRDTFNFTHRAEPRYKTDQKFASTKGLDSKLLKERLKVILEFRIKELTDKKHSYEKSLAGQSYITQIAKKFVNDEFEASSVRSDIDTSETNSAQNLEKELNSTSETDTHDPNRPNSNPLSHDDMTSSSTEKSKKTLDSSKYDKIRVFHKSFDIHCKIHSVNFAIFISSYRSSPIISIPIIFPPFHLSTM
jgi:hypothetical protein